MMKNIGLLFFGIIILMSCRQNTSQEKKGDAVETDIPSEQTVGIPEAWINKRVTSAERRLKSTDAGRVVWNAMEAHGGLKKWYSNGALSFRFNYQPLDGKTQRDSYQTIDTWRNRARHTSTSDSTARYGWTGETAWVKATDSTAFDYDSRFCALKPFYFLGQPFVLDGDGVNLELLPPTTYKNETQEVVKVTFDPGTGDAPDDYY
ncbi:MAG: hypothetical protein HKN31_16245, partial [Pricia sp.]|nr:hypothetical protein [Pricia sp.]